jgi:single-strand DNA-binding protein
MASFNKVVLVGNLTRDPELRYTPKGTAIAKVGLAVNHKWKNEAGEMKEEVTFVDIEVWGRTAENVGQYMRKGSSMLVEGRLKLETWDDKQTNQKRSKMLVVGETVQFLGSPRGGESAPSEPRASRAAAAKPPAAMEESDGPPPEEDDVPF